MPKSCPNRQRLNYFSESGFLNPRCKGRASALLPCGKTRSKNVDMLEMAIGIQQCKSWDDLAKYCVNELNTLCGAMNVSWLEINGDSYETLWRHCSNPEGLKSCQRGADEIMLLSPELAGFFEGANSLLREDSPQTYTLSEFFSRSELGDTVYFHDHLEQRGVGEVFCFQAYHSVSANSVFVSVCFSHRECTSCEGSATNNQEVFKLLVRCIRGACNQLARMSNLLIMGEAFREVSRHDARVGMGVVDAQADRLWDANTMAIELLKELGACYGSELGLYFPVYLRDWIQQELKESKRAVACEPRVNRLFYSWKLGEINVMLLLKQAGQGAVLVCSKSCDDEGNHGFNDLSPREFDVIRCLCVGMTNKQISEGLSISCRTAEKHIQRILSKMKCQDRLAVMEHCALFHTTGQCHMPES